MNYKSISWILWPPKRKKLGKFSTQCKYFQFVYWNKISFWNVIVAISLAKWKTLQNPIMYYFRKEAPTFLVWRKNFFLQFYRQNRVIHKGRIRNMQWKTLEIPLFSFTGSVARCRMVDTGNYRKRRNELMVKTVEWNRRGTSCFTQTAHNWLLSVLLILWTPDVVNKTGQNINL